MRIFVVIYLLNYSVTCFMVDSDVLNNNEQTKTRLFDIPNRHSMGKIDSDDNLRSNMYNQLDTVSNGYESSDEDEGDASVSKDYSFQVMKRKWRVPNLELARFIQQRLYTRPEAVDEPRPHAIARRRSQVLSVSGPLSALADMLAAEGRQRFHQESHLNRMRLRELGKRSEETEEQPQW